MADIDNEKSGYVESFSKVDGPGAGSGETVVTVDVAEQKDSPTNSVPNVQSTASPNISSGATSSVASHPKKFSTVNINKKFMEKNSATPSASQPSSSFSNVKSGTSNGS
jgi:serine/arginine repetitive matrix protein 2